LTFESLRFIRLIVSGRANLNDVLMDEALMALIVDDSAEDTQLMVRVLQDGGFAVAYHRVDTAAGMRAAFQAPPWDVVLCDYAMPQFDGQAALTLYKELQLDIPFIVVSGAIGEERVADLLKAGAHDCVLKTNLPRLAPAVRAALRAVQQQRIGRGTNSRADYLASLVESSNEAIIGKTLDGTIISWNKGAEHMYGYSAQEMVGRSVSVLFPPNRPEELPEILERLKTGATVAPYETVRLRKDGTRVDVAVTVSPIKDFAGRVIGASSITRDLSQFRAQEDERLRLIQDLTDALNRMEQQPA
jgi:PAS domain S-box-containing protein